VPTALDPRLLDATASLLDRAGLAAVTMSAVADGAGISRVTLHRHGVTVEDLVIAVLGRASDDLRASLWPVLAGPGTAAERLRAALEALCRVAERHSGVLSALFRAPVRPLPDDPGRTTSFEFVEPFERLLLDGQVDGSLRSDEPATEAALLANTVTWSYLHMRQAHGWSPDDTVQRVLDLVLARHLPQ
jgi:AcrR family transcriptional regulator